MTWREDRSAGLSGWSRASCPDSPNLGLAAIVGNPAGAALIVIALAASLASARSFSNASATVRARAWNVRNEGERDRARSPAADGPTPCLGQSNTDLCRPCNCGMGPFESAMALRAVRRRRYRVRVVVGFPQVRPPCWKHQSGKPGFTARLCAGGADVSRRRSRLPIHRANARTPRLPRFERDVVLSVAHRAVFDLVSTGGTYCMGTLESKAQSTQKGQAQSTQTKEIRRSLTRATFRTDSICHATGLRLIAGRKYRIRLDMERGRERRMVRQGHTRRRGRIRRQQETALHGVAT